jgi:hypothetical protein
MAEIERARDVRGWFGARLAEAAARRAFETQPETAAYLAELLGSYAERTADALLEPFALQLVAAREAAGSERVERYRDLGDTALYVSGFFVDHLAHRGVTLAYAAAMGRRAYEVLEALAVSHPREAPRRLVYRDLSQRFDRYVGLLDEVRTAGRAPVGVQDLVRLYERYRARPTDHLRAELARAGLSFGDETLH